MLGLALALPSRLAGVRIQSVCACRSERFSGSTFKGRLSRVPCAWPCDSLSDAGITRPGEGPGGRAGGAARARPASAGSGDFVATGPDTHAGRPARESRHRAARTVVPREASKGWRFARRATAPTRGGCIFAVPKTLTKTPCSSTGVSPVQYCTLTFGKRTRTVLRWCKNVLGSDTYARNAYQTRRQLVGQVLLNVAR